MKSETTLTFEEALKSLEESASAMDKEQLTLEEALKNYEDGIGYYKRCEEIIKSAKQKVETFKK